MPVTCTVAADPAASEPMVQVAATIVHVPTLVDMPVTVNPLGIVSANVTLLASDGPALVTTTVHVATSPACRL